MNPRGVLFDLTGKRFGRLLVIGISTAIGDGALWVCRCDCGKETLSRGRPLRVGDKKSCGCLKAEADKAMVIDLTGKRFGKLIAVRQHEAKAHSIHWECLCDCGQAAVVDGCDLRKGKTKSCGCLRNQPGGVPGPAAGMTKVERGKIGYSSWASMIERCHNPKHKSYSHYGGRGISVCPRWRDGFANFYADMGQKPSPKHSIDRKNGLLGYFPENCRWATKKEQDDNRSNTVFATAFGKRMSIARWSEQTGVPLRIIWLRLNSGWDEERAVNSPVSKTSNLDENKVSEIRRRRAAGDSFRKLGSSFGINHKTVYSICARRTWKHVA